MQTRTESKVEASDCSTQVLVVAEAVWILVIEKSSCFSLLNSSRVLPGPCMPLNQYMTHKLELETTEIYLDSICKFVSDYVSCYIPIDKGDGQNTNWNSLGTNQSEWWEQP